MADPESRPSEKKIAALLLIAVLAAAIGIYSYGKEAPQSTGFLRSVADKISLTGFALHSDGPEDQLTIVSSLSFDAVPDISLKLQKPAERLIVSTSGENTVTIDRNTWELLDGTAVDMKNFTGKVTLGPFVSVSGKSYSVRLNLASQSVSDKGLPVQATLISTKSVIFTGADSIDIDLKNITGTIKANDGKNSATYSVKNSLLSVSGFSGDLEFYGDRIVLNGKATLNADLLKNGR